MKDRQTRQFTNLIFSIFLLFGVVGLATTATLWTLSDITGEYNCISPRLGMVRLSLLRKGEVLKGDLVYNNCAKLELVGSASVRQEEVNLSFEPPREFPRKGRSRRVSLIGKFENGGILGVIVDSGTPYPVNLHRNVIYSVVKRVNSFWPGS